MCRRAHGGTSYQPSSRSRSIRLVDLPRRVGPTSPTPIALAPAGALHRSTAVRTLGNCRLRPYETLYGELLEFEGPVRHLAADGEVVADPERTHPVAKSLRGFERGARKRRVVVGEVEEDVSALPRLGRARDDPVEPVGLPIADVPDGPVGEVGVGALIRHEQRGSLDGFALDVRRDRPDRVRVVAPDPVEDRPRRVRYTDCRPLHAVDGVPDGRILTLGRREHRLVVELAGRPASMSLAVGDVFVGPIAERFPRPDRRERPDHATPVLPAGVSIASGLGDRFGLVDVESLPERAPREPDDRIRNRPFPNHQPRVRPLVVCHGSSLDRIASDGERFQDAEIGVDAERGVPSRLVLYRGVQSDEHQPLDGPTGRPYSPGDPRGEIGRTHPRLARVGVVEPDERHSVGYHPSNNPVPDRLSYLALSPLETKIAGRGVLPSPQSIYGYAHLDTPMSRSALVGNVTAMLEDAGFLVSERCAVRPKSFDVAARRDDDLLLVKILGNIDAFDGRTGLEMRRLGGFLDATPMVIGLRTRDEELKPGVMYLRHGVPRAEPRHRARPLRRGRPADDLRRAWRALRQHRRQGARRRARGARLESRPARHRTRGLAPDGLEVRGRYERLRRGRRADGGPPRRAAREPRRRLRESRRTRRGGRSGFGLLGGPTGRGVDAGRASTSIPRPARRSPP